MNVRLLAASRGEKHRLDVLHGGDVRQHVYVLVAWQLFERDGLLLLPHPPLALHGAPQVDRPVPVAVHHLRLHVWELVRIPEGLRRGDAVAVQAVDGNAGGGQVRHQRLGVLTHQPAFCETDVRVEFLIVLHGVVVGGGLDKNLEVENRKIK